MMVEVEWAGNRARGRTDKTYTVVHLATPQINVLKTGNLELVCNGMWLIRLSLTLSLSPSVHTVCSPGPSLSRRDRMEYLTWKLF